MDAFFIWAIGKPVSPGLQVVILVTLAAAVYHWTHLIKWAIESWRKEDEE